MTLKDVKFQYEWCLSIGQWTLTTPRRGICTSNLGIQVLTCMCSKFYAHEPNYIWESFLFLMKVLINHDTKRNADYRGLKMPLTSMVRWKCIGIAPKGNI